MATPALADVLATADLRPCTYLELVCMVHGDLRIAVAYKPSNP
jgi:hypothetical protein